MLIHSIKDIIELARKRGPKKLAVACPDDKNVLSAVSRAKNAGIICPILVGDRSNIESVADSIELDISEYEILDFPIKEEACLKSVSLVSSGDADFLMKGLVDTSTLLKAVLHEEFGLRSGKILSHISIMELPNYPKLLTVTDAAMNISPDLSAKVQIIENAVDVLLKLGIETPQVAAICAIEKVNPKMPSTVDAYELMKMNEAGEIKNCVVGGPLGLDNAISEKAAEIKGIKHPVAGHADILLCPDIEAGNILYKALSFLAYAKSGSIIVGATAPVVLTSRADCEDVKFNSIALGVISIEKL